MSGSKLQNNMRKEQFHIAFVHAIASVYGWRIQKPDPDYDGIDLEISGTIDIIDNECIPDPRISVQLKATSYLRELPDGTVKYDLEVKNYNQLIGKFSAPRYLFILDVPKNNKDWCSLTDDSLILKNKCYWLSLKGQPKSNNKKTVSVNVNPNQILTPSVLNDILYAASNGKVL